MTMIERVARAIDDACINGSSHDIARAAIAAMREPTEAMTFAGRERNNVNPVVGVWQAMIDAALNR